MKYYKGKDTFIDYLFTELSTENQRRLLRLISRIAEQSYRRGAQQAMVMGENENIEEWILSDEAYSWRFEKTLDRSIGLDGYTTPSLERLLIEEPALEKLNRGKT
jgi:hypothetical protein